MAISISSDKDKPNFARPEYKAAIPDLKLIEDELGGTRAMHEASHLYIRKWKAESKPNYDLRRKCETFFEGLGRTLSAATGMLFAKPPTIEWGPSEVLLSIHADNIDNAGTELMVWAKMFSESAVRDGLAAILVDHTPSPLDEEGNPRTPSAEEEERLNLRPVWTRYERKQIINWRTSTISNERKLTLVVLAEEAEEPEGVYGLRIAQRFRVLRLVGVPNLPGTRMVARWEVWERREEKNGKETFSPISSGFFTDKFGNIAEEIPLAVAYAGRTDAPMVATMPLQGVAWANLSHWQLSTSLRFNTEVAGIAQPTVVGSLARDSEGKEKPMEIGPLVLVQVEQGGDFKWTEPQGTGLERLALLVLEKLRQIGAQGMSFLTADTRAAETAEAKRLDAAAENATLATAAQGIEDAINLAWEFHCWFLGIEKDSAPVVTISRDYEDTSMSSDIMNAYTKAIKEAGLPIRLLLQAWQQGGRIPADANLEEIEMEMMAEMASQAEAEEERRLALVEDGGAPEPEPEPEDVAA
jgi:hypothetical protein